MARVGCAMLVLAATSMGGVGPEAHANEASASCLVKAFSYEQLCTEPSKPERESRRLLDEAGQPQPCRETASGSDVLAKLEVTLDREGRLVRAKLLGTPGSCTKACLERALKLSFSTGSAAGTTTMQSTTVVCTSGPAVQRGSGRTRG